HLPILGIPFGLALLVYGVLRHQQEIQKLALAVFVLCGLALVPVYLTGEPSEEAVENLPAVSEPILEQHEDAARLSLIVVELLAAGSLLGLAAYRRHDVPGGVIVPLMLLALLSSGSLTYTGYLGGQIRHSEIRAGSAVVVPAEEGHVDDD
ncbi:MAG: hypothetical protein AB1758_00835, partial [Candidatus Eremiobacterota bacterium]